MEPADEAGGAEEEEEGEKREQEERRRNAEYLQFRRRFDQMKRDREGVLAESEKLKQQGNHFFSLGLYMQAAVMYSEAIELQPENAVLYCNRAMAYLKQDMPDEALADAEQSMALDSTEGNIKAYWRKAQALLDLGRSSASEAAADAGLGIQGGNQHLNRVRRKAREARTLQLFCGGEWLAQMANGIEKRFSFAADGSMSLTVFGHSVPATFELSVEGNPRSIVIRMRPDCAGPPAPPMPYIYEFHDDGQELWLCHPVGTRDLPTKFEGPGFDRLRRAAAPDAEEEEGKDGDQPLDVRCAQYIRDMNEIMPLLPPQLPQRPSEDEIQEESLRMESISQLKRCWGRQVHQRAVELAKDPQAANGAELARLARELQRRFVARRIIPPPAEAEAPLFEQARAPDADVELAAPRAAEDGSRRLATPSSVGCLAVLAKIFCARGGNSKRQPRSFCGCHFGKTAGWLSGVQGLLGHAPRTRKS